MLHQFVWNLKEQTQKIIKIQKIKNKKKKEKKKLVLGQQKNHTVGV